MNKERAVKGEAFLMGNQSALQLRSHNESIVNSAELFVNGRLSVAWMNEWSSIIYKKMTQNGLRYEHDLTDQLLFDWSMIARFPFCQPQPFWFNTVIQTLVSCSQVVGETQSCTAWLHNCPSALCTLMCVSDLRTQVFRPVKIFSLTAFSQPEDSYSTAL